MHIMSRTNIDIDDELLSRVMARLGVHTKKEAVDLALRHVVGQPMTVDEALEMRGAHAIGDAPTDRGP
jgi:Arc/MetJ family transcription regulator